MSELGGRIYQVAIVLIFIAMGVSYYVLDMPVERAAVIGLVIAVPAAVALAGVVLFHEEDETDG
jgi:hypothetical protein